MHTNHRFVFILLFHLVTLRLFGVTPTETQIFLIKPEMPSNALVMSHLKGNYALSVVNSVVNKEGMEFQIPSGTISISLSAQPMADDDWYAYSTIAWLWKSAEKDIRGHKAFLRISFTPKTTIDTYQAELDLARVVASVLHAMPNNALGVLLADRYLLLESSFYKETMRNLPPNEVPTYLLVYFGLNQNQSKNSAFTYGMHRFDMPEIEIVNSDRSTHEVHDIMVQYVNSLLSPGSGEAIKYPTTITEGIFLQGKTLKIKI